MSYLMSSRERNKRNLDRPVKLNSTLDQMLQIIAARVAQRLRDNRREQASNATSSGASDAGRNRARIGSQTRRVDEAKR